MRLTITRTIAPAAAGIAILCTGVIAWITDRNLRRGFIDSLNRRAALGLDRLQSVYGIDYRFEPPR